MLSVEMRRTLAEPSKEAPAFAPIRFRMLTQFVSKQPSLRSISHIIDACLCMAVFSCNQYIREARASRRVEGGKRW